MQIEIDKTDLANLYVLMQPTRQRIIQLLKKNPDNPMYIREIANAIKESERNTSFHLSTLAEHGFVTGEYREIADPTHHSPVTGRAAKFYSITPTVDEIIKKIVKEI